MEITPETIQRLNLVKLETFVLDEWTYGVDGCQSGEGIFIKNCVEGEMIGNDKAIITLVGRVRDNERIVINKNIYYQFVTIEFINDISLAMLKIIMNQVKIENPL